MTTSDPTPNRLMLGNRNADLVKIYRERFRQDGVDWIPSFARYLRQLDGLAAVYQVARRPPPLRSLISDWSYEGVARHVGWRELRRLQSNEPNHELAP